MNRQLDHDLRMPAPEPAQAGRTSSARRGMVLIIVMIVVVMVSLAGFSFVATMHNEDRATRLRGSEVQAEQLVASAEELMRSLIELPPDERESVGGFDDNPELLQGMLVFEDEQRQERGRITILSPRFEEGRPAGYRYGLENESAKLNLSMLPQWDKNHPKSARAALEQLPGMSEAISDALLDWLDEDDQPHPLGAESEYYQTLASPYGPRNGPIECLEELLLVRGVTRELLYGWDSNYNYQIDREELLRAETTTNARASEDPATSLPWSRLLTVHSAERNVDPQGKPRINLNDSNANQLHRNLSRVLDRPVANFVALYRLHGAYKGKAAANTNANTAVSLSGPAKKKIVSPLELVGAKIRASKPGKKPVRIMASPLQEEAANFRKNLLELLDYTTVTSTPARPGRINVNLAPESVLSMIPGIDEGTVRQILSARETRSSAQDPERRHAVWLMFEGIVDLEQMRKLEPYITCGGSVYRAQLVGGYDLQGPTARAEVVLDATQLPARRVYWKDLRILGRGFSWETLGTEKSNELGSFRSFPGSGPGTAGTY